MTKQGQQTKNEPIRRMVEQHLRYREQVALDTPTGAHLDEDRLAAFVEGCLSQAESAPVVSHLVACSPCRHVTVELLRLELELEDAPAAAAATTAQPSEPGRIRRLLESLAARVLPQSDEDAVFAYHAPAEDAQTEKPATALTGGAESQPATPPASPEGSPCSKNK